MRLRLFSEIIWSKILDLKPQTTGLVSLKKPRLKWIILICGLIVVLFSALMIGGYTWYKNQLTPLDSGKNTHSIRFTIDSGDSLQDIAQKLEEKNIIHSAFALELYARFERPNSSFQAGTYALSPSQSVESIIKRLESGKTDLFMITILPGKTLTDLKKLFQEYGYSAQEVDKAFKTTYDSPLLSDKPAETTLEGYIYPETFEVGSTASLSELIQRDMDTLYARLDEKGLLEVYKQKGLTIYQALTLASIIQNEASSPADQRQIAQVFFKRLGMDMKLESDPTFIYGATRLGVEPRVNVDSPYNTRLYKGLPPGPISNMNLSALEAVAYPSEGEYLYFVAGDDGTTHFSMTLEEHEQKAKTYCKKLCNIY